MPKVNVIKPFFFVRPNHTYAHFQPGVQELPEDIANHPWVKNELAGGAIAAPEPEPEPQPAPPKGKKAAGADLSGGASSGSGAG